MWPGASLTASYSGTIEQEVVTTDSLTYQMTVSGSLTATSAADSIHTVMLAYFGNNLGSAVSAGTVYPLVAGVPADGCSSLSYPYALPGKVVMLSRGNCTFEYKVCTHLRPCCWCLPEGILQQSFAVEHNPLAYSTAIQSCTHLRPWCWCWCICTYTGQRA